MCIRDRVVVAVLRGGEARLGGLPLAAQPAVDPVHAFIQAERPGEPERVAAVVPQRQRDPERLPLPPDGGPPLLDREVARWLAAAELVPVQVAAIRLRADPRG